MEYICAGDLLSYIKKRGKLTEQVAKFIFKQIVLSLQYIHSHNIVHRDIKLDNILIDLDNNIKICDFGVSKIVKKGEPMMEQVVLQHI
jgi:serine/threonine protein kinase